MLRQISSGECLIIRRLDQSELRREREKFGWEAQMLCALVCVGATLGRRSLWLAPGEE
jgi:hypothetical protein